MIERFEKRNITGSINIKLEGRPDWTARKEDIVRSIIHTVEEYNEKGYKLTLRQLYYQLVAADSIPNHDKVYKKLSSILDDCRYSGLVDWSAIEDRGRVPFQPYFEHGIPAALKRTAEYYQLNKQNGQPKHIEVWTEKDAISNILRNEVVKFSVKLVVNKGYISSSALHNAYLRFAHEINSGRKVTILYFGDHDPSGLDMVRDIRERLTFFFYNGKALHDGIAADWSGISNDYIKDEVWDKYEGDESCETDGYFDEKKAFIKEHFEIIPVGLTIQQIKAYNPPPNPAKITDPRAAWYIKKHGNKSWEVDALKPEIMAQIIREAIVQQMEVDIFNSVVENEQSDIRKIYKIVENINDGE